MNPNPLQDIAINAQKQQLANRLNKIESDIKLLKGGNMNLVELEVFSGLKSLKKTIRLNPAHVSYIESGDGQTTIHMIDGTALTTELSYNDVIRKCSDNSNTYIG